MSGGVEQAVIEVTVGPDRAHVRALGSFMIRRGIGKQWRICCYVTLATPLALYWLLGESASTSASAGAGLVGCALLALHYGARWRSILLVRRASADEWPTRYSFTSEGVRITRPGMTSQVDWSFFHEVAISKGRMFLMVTPFSGMVAPLTAFTDEAEALQVFNWAHAAKINAHSAAARM